MSQTVVVAMSGGVDSSVAAALLKEQGYRVVGMTMRLADWEREGRTFGGCCGSKDFYDAVRWRNRWGFRITATITSKLSKSP